MTARDVLQELQDAGIELQMIEGGLRCRPRAALTPKLRAELGMHKLEIIAILAQTELDWWQRYLGHKVIRAAQWGKADDLFMAGWK